VNKRIGELSLAHSSKIELIEQLYKEGLILYDPDPEENTIKDSVKT